MINTLRFILFKIKQVPLEAWIWTTGLIVLAFYNPYDESTITICPLHHMGLDFCPGCGLGRSISFFFHGELRLSFATHPLGIVSFFILVLRIITLTKKSLTPYG